MVVAEWPLGWAVELKDVMSIWFYNIPKVVLFIPLISKKRTAIKNEVMN